MAITPPTYTPSGSLFGTTTTATPYTYGNLGTSTSAYNIWGSKGNPYLIAGPTYTPGSGMPIVPQPIPFVPPVNNGGGDSSPIPDWTDPNSPEAQANNYADLQSWLGRDKYITRGVSGAFGLPLLDPAVDLMYGINPITQQSLSWYDGSTDDFNYVGSDESLQGKDYSAAVAAYDQDFMNDMTDLDQDEYVDAYMSERGWGADTPAVNNNWGSKGFTGDLFNTNTGRGFATPQTFADPNDPLKAEGVKLQEKAQATIRAQEKAVEAKQAAEAAKSRADAERYENLTSQIDSLNTQIMDSRGKTTEQINDLYDQLEIVEGNLTQQISDFDRASNTYITNNTFAPTDTITGDTGTWTNPASGTDTSTLSGTTGTTNASVSWSDNTDSGGNTTGTFTSDEMGATNVTDYGNGQYSVDVGEDDQVGWEDPGSSSDSGGGDSGGGGKIVCTAMNEDYGFGSYRNAIWLKYSEKHYKDKPEMEIGYHAIFRPLLKIRKKWYGKPLYTWMKHVARHRTADLRAEMYGRKRDRIGQAWRFILEPLCYFVGKRLNKGDK